MIVVFFLCERVCMHNRDTSAAECLALPRSSEGTVMQGLWVVMNKTVNPMFLLDWPLLMAPGYSSSVLMWKAAGHSTASLLPPRPSPIKKKRET